MNHDRFKFKGFCFLSVLIGILSMSGFIFSQGIIIDHNCTDISKIPASWINKVKSSLKIHYAHTSHGGQITEGLERLSNANSTYSFYPDNCTVPQTTQYLSLMDGQYIYDYCETYVTPDLYWEGQYGLNITRSVLNGSTANVSMWAWCTQLDYYSQAETRAYLDAMSQLETEYPNVTFVYMTGNAQSEEQNRYNRNNQIRDYCRANNKVLFDFADLDSWYNGQQHTMNGIPMEHPHYYGDQGGHTTYESCENKAKAAWWLLARIAGWDGSSSGGGGTDGQAEPFGSFDTPLDGSTVRSSVPVTGWALDDAAVESVKIYRSPVAGAETGLIYVGDASFVEGARPDIQAAYPGYPYNSKAGWGYMMLTNFLPNGGNGTFTFYAIARDGSGNQVTLGTKTVTCDNAHAVKPFGAIETPTQGGAASGSAFINWGWVLTPPPNKIPVNGSTINVIVDGVNIGHPNYNIYRSDIASLFPGYANSSGAIGYFYLDASSYENGVHTIQWTATDNDGNTDGIGSRYFTIQGAGGRAALNSERRSTPADNDCFGLPVEDPWPVQVKKGYDRHPRPQTHYPGDNGVIAVEIKETEPLEIDFGRRIINVSPLPTGSTLDEKRGILYWLPGVGFSGSYEFVFIDRDENRLQRIRIKISAKGSGGSIHPHDRANQPR